MSLAFTGTPGISIQAGVLSSSKVSSTIQYRIRKPWTGSCIPAPKWQAISNTTRKYPRRATPLNGNAPTMLVSAPVALTILILIGVVAALVSAMSPKRKSKIGKKISEVMIPRSSAFANENNDDQHDGHRNLKTGGILGLRVHAPAAASAMSPSSVISSPLVMSNTEPPTLADRIKALDEQIEDASRTDTIGNSDFAKEFEGKGLDDIGEILKERHRQATGSESADGWYDRLNGLQRAFLMSKAFEEAKLEHEMAEMGQGAASMELPRDRASPSVESKKSAESPSTLAPSRDYIRFEFRIPYTYLRFAEDLNGQLAIIALILGLLRQYIEPSHPTFWEQAAQIAQLPTFFVSFMKAVQHEMLVQSSVQLSSALLHTTTNFLFPISSTG